MLVPSEVSSLKGVGSQSVEGGEGQSAGESSGAASETSGDTDGGTGSEVGDRSLRGVQTTSSVAR